MDGLILDPTFQQQYLQLLKRTNRFKDRCPYCGKEAFASNHTWRSPKGPEVDKLREIWDSCRNNPANLKPSDRKSRSADDEEAEDRRQQEEASTYVDWILVAHPELAKDNEIDESGFVVVEKPNDQNKKIEGGRGSNSEYQDCNI